MKKQNIQALIESVDEVLKSSNTNLSHGDRKKLKSIKKELKDELFVFKEETSERDNVPFYSQILILLMEIIKNVSD